MPPPIPPCQTGRSGAPGNKTDAAITATTVSHLPPTSVMFAALLGYNPIQMLLGPVLATLPASHAAYLTSPRSARLDGGGG